MAETLTINPNDVKLLREKTNAGMMDCKRALEEAKGSLEEAEKILRKKLNLSASKKASREAKEGIIASYIHLGGKVGVLVEVNCETDFVARNETFREFVKDITLHIAAANPQFLTREDVPASIIDQERDIAAAQVKDKPPAVVEKIVSGKLDKVFNTLCLLEQPFIKDTNRTIRDLVNDKISELGENLVIKRFVRFALGESTT